MNTLRPLLTAVLVPLIIVYPVAAETSAGELQIHASNADGAVVYMGSQSAQGFAIQVTDAAGTAVSDAAVLVRLPETGTTGVFHDGTHATVGYTDGSGRTHISGVTWDKASGIFPVTITASKGDAHAGTILEQTISATPIAMPVALPAPAIAPVPSLSGSADRVADAAKIPSAPPAPVVAPPAVPVPQPGTVAVPQVAAAAERDLRLPPPAPAESEAPSVSVVNTSSHESFETGSSHKKWLIIAAIVAAGAGAGFAFSGKKSSSSSTSSTTSSISIGTPTISVGAP